MISALNDPIHCHKFKKKTKNIDSKIVQTNNGLYRIATKCDICKTNKSKLIEKPKDEIKWITKQKLNKKEILI